MQSIYVGEILPRGNFSRSPDPHLNGEIFEDQRKKKNKLLEKKYKTKLIRFVDIKYLTDYCPDGVHLLTPSEGSRKTVQRTLARHTVQPEILSLLTQQWSFLGPTIFPDRITNELLSFSYFFFFFFFFCTCFPHSHSHPRSHKLSSRPNLGLPEPTQTQP